MLKESNRLTDAVIQLINAMPEKEREKIAHRIAKRKRNKSRTEKTQRGKIKSEKELKNYDSKKISTLLSKIRTKKIFQNTEDPSAWQRQLRDEWK